MSGGWPPALAFFGLHVDCGHYQYKPGRWLRLPVATFTCRCGYEYKAVGAADVAHVTEHIHAIHARSCPRAQRKDPV